MIDRTSSFGHQAIATAQMMRTQSAYRETQTQVSTGLKDTAAAGLGADAAAMSSLDRTLASSASYITASENALTSVEAAYGALGSMIDVLQGAKNGLVQALGGEWADDANLNARSERALEDFVGLANTRHGGSYLFSGHSTDVAPVTVTAPPYPPQTAPSTPDWSYYRGDGAERSVRTADDQTISYGIPGNDDAFEKGLRGLSLAANASEAPLDRAAVEEALALIDASIDGLADLQARSSANSHSLEMAIDHQIGVQLMTEATLSDIKDVDVGKALAELEQRKAQLEASYAALAQVKDMSLFDYLR